MQKNTMGDDQPSTESIGVTEMQTEVQNKVSDYQKAWLSHLNDFDRLLFKMRSSEELAKHKKASESMARIIGIATANYEQMLMGEAN